ncbi:hypothetical protein OPV22_002424 [Ensete ventricosum]|uniref:Uncharacterized protein n=1 Tax=Ensete ventricosum TaxID=4639 RepID=A0AAV8RY08_ENSVE|nr:hypothetical protein OPV22_002424 [Ensete ventricosum]
MGFKAAQLQQNSLIAVWALGFTVENKNIALEIAIGYAAPTPRFSPLPLCCQAIPRPHCRLPALPTTVVPLRRLCDKGSRLQEMQNAAQSPPKPKPPRAPPPAAGIGPCFGRMGRYSSEAGPLTLKGKIRSRKRVIHPILGHRWCAGVERHGHELGHHGNEG